MKVEGEHIPVGYSLKTFGRILTVLLTGEFSAPRKVHGICKISIRICEVNGQRRAEAESSLELNYGKGANF